MKILIVTQKVDRKDPILGFFHKWIDEFALRCASVTVIAQQTGDYHLPHNVTVHSLGKESGRSILMQVLRALWLFWSERKKYDVVFVHMTPIWVLIGAPLWTVLGKIRYLWYEIKRGSWKLSASLHLVRQVFAASKHGLPSVASKQIVTGHGIDTQRFARGIESRNQNLVVAVGRMTRVKRYDLILRCFATLPDSYTLMVAGGTVTEADKTEQQRFDDLAEELGIVDRVKVQWVEPEKLPALLQKATLSLHACEGGLDKVVLQAMSCGLPVVSVSEAATDVLPHSLQATEDTFAKAAHDVCSLSSEDYEQLSVHLREIVEKNHALEKLIEKLVKHMQCDTLRKT